MTTQRTLLHRWAPGMPYKDILTEASRKAALAGQPNGLSSQKMNSRQRELLTRVIDEYIYNVPDQVAQSRAEKVKKAGNNIHFAWAGPIEKNQPHYYLQKWW